MTTNEYIRLKFLFTGRIGGAWGNEPEEDNSVVCIRAADFDTDKIAHKTYDLTRRSYSADEIRKKSLSVGDLIIEKSGGGDNQPVGRIARFSLDEPALCSNFMEILRPKQEKLFPPYGAYILYSLWSSRAVIPAIKQTTGIQNLDAEEYLDIKVDIPPLPTQRRIAAYLDRETAHIDTLIAAKERLLLLMAEKRQALIARAVTRGLDEAVKLKDSGVAWLGEVPEGWTISSIKYVTKKVGSGVTPKGGSEVYKQEGILFLRSQNVHFSKLQLEDVVYISEEVHESMSNSKVENGDVLLNVTGASIGRCFYYEGISGQANVNQHVCIVRPNEKITTKFLNYVLASDVGQNQIGIFQTGGGREGLNFETLKSFVLPLPSIEDQNEIVEFLDIETFKLNSINEATQKTISLLKERRSALIAAAVTGQLNIPES